MKNQVQTFIQDESGATAIEYGLLAALVALGIAVGAIVAIEAFATLNLVGLGALAGDVARFKGAPYLAPAKRLDETRAARAQDFRQQVRGGPPDPGLSHRSPSSPR